MRGMESGYESGSGECESVMYVRVCKEEEGGEVCVEEREREGGLFIYLRVVCVEVGV
jgi:hypothetical protein